MIGHPKLQMERYMKALINVVGLNTRDLARGNNGNSCSEQPVQSELNCVPYSMHTFAIATRTIFHLTGQIDYIALVEHRSADSCTTARSHGFSSPSIQDEMVAQSCRHGAANDNTTRTICP